MDTSEPHNKAPEPTRREFLYLTAGALGAVGVGGLMWPFINSMNPAANVLAVSSIDVDLSPIAEGQAITVMWRGKPVFIRHRTADEIQAARAVALSDLPDPQSDETRFAKPEWLVVIGICTHLGCVPSGQKSSDKKGDFGGWFCPCHGSEYDTSGRIRRGPAPANLPVPPFTFIDDKRIRIG